MDTFSFNCASCGKVIQAPTNGVGKKGRCKECGEVQIIPIPDGVDDDLDDIEEDPAPKKLPVLAVQLEQLPEVSWGLDLEKELENLLEVLENCLAEKELVQPKILRRQ